MGGGGWGGVGGGSACLPRCILPICIRMSCGRCWRTSSPIRTASSAMACRGKISLALGRSWASCFARGLPRALQTSAPEQWATHGAGAKLLTKLAQSQNDALLSAGRQDDTLMSEDEFHDALLSSLKMKAATTAPCTELSR